jgi:hypothetical protein
VAHQLEGIVYTDLSDGRAVGELLGTSSHGGIIYFPAEWMTTATRPYGAAKAFRRRDSSAAATASTRPQSRPEPADVAAQPHDPRTGLFEPARHAPA